MKYKVTEEEAPKELSIPARLGAMTAINPIQSLVGGAGNIVSGAADLLSSATGGRTPTGQQVQDFLPSFTNTITNPLTIPIKAGAKALGYLAGSEKPSQITDTLLGKGGIPTEEQIEQGFEKNTGYTKRPKGAPEQFYSDVLGDIGTFIPGLLSGGTAVGAKAIAKKIAQYGGASVAGNLTKRGTAALGGGPIAQAIAKTVTMAGVNGLKTREAVQQLEKDSYEKAHTAAAGQNWDASDLLKAENKFDKTLNHRDFEGKDFVEARLKSLKDILYDKNNKKAGIVPVQKIHDIKRDFNNYIGSPKTPENAIPWLKRMVGASNEFLNSFGKYSPEFGKNFKLADELHTGLNAMSKTSEFLQKNVTLESLKNPVLAGALSSIFAGGTYLFGLLPAVATVGGAGTIAHGVKEALRFKDMLTNSQHARTIWQNLLKEGVKENAPAIARDLSKLDKVAEKYFGKSNPKSSGMKYKIIEE